MSNVGPTLESTRVSLVNMLLHISTLHSKQNMPTVPISPQEDEKFYIANLPPLFMRETPSIERKTF